MKHFKNNRMNWWKVPAGILVGYAASFLSVIILQLFHDQFNIEKVLQLLDYKTRLHFLEANVVFLFFILISCMIGSPWMSSIIVVLISLLLGITTQQKAFYRGEPLYPSDIYFLKDFSFIVNMVNPGIIVVIGIILLLIGGSVIYYIVKRSKKSVPFGIKVIRLVGFTFSCAALFYVSQFNQPENKVRELIDKRTYWVTFNQNINYTNNGVISGLLYNLKSPAVERPADYSKEKINELYDLYVEKAEKTNKNRLGNLVDVNIVYIMNESFSDPYQIEGIEITGGDALEKYRAISEKNIHGQTLSQSYGGGTANIEFEAITGVSMEPLAANISTPFIQMSYQMKNLPTILDYMKNSEHELTGIHPHGTTMYKRVENYKSLGFDNLIFVDDLTYSDKIDDNYYISDEAAYKELLDVLKGSDKKDFVHLLTIQNHKPNGDYAGKYKDVEFNVSGSNNDENIEHYLKGMEYSDDALDFLFKELDKWEEKVIVIFWGDHLPSLYNNDLYTTNGHLLMHQTPLLIYSNFGDETGDIGTLSPIYFQNYILKMTDTKVTPFTALLIQMEERLPAFEKGFYMENHSEVKKNREELEEETQRLLHDYDLILYDITTGDNYSKELGFY